MSFKKENEIAEVFDLKENFSENLMEKVECMDQNLTIYEFDVVHKRLMHHPTNLLRLIGLFHKKNDNKLFKGYCFVMTLIVGLNSFRYLFTFYGENENFLSGTFIFKIGLLEIITIMAINSAIMFINQEFYSKENNFFYELNLVFQNIENLSLKKLALKINVFFLIATIISIADSFAMFLIIFFPDYILLSKNEIEFSRIHLTPFHNQIWSPNSFWCKSFACLFHWISYTHTALSFAYVMSFCYIVRFLFLDYNQKFEKSLLNKETQMSEIEFEKFRILHLQLIGVVKKMDSCYNKYIGFNILGSVVGIVFTVYLFSSWKETFETKSFKVSLFCAILLLVLQHLLLIFLAADINTKVRSF